MLNARGVEGFIEFNASQLSNYKIKKKKKKKKKG